MYEDDVPDIVHTTTSEEAFPEDPIAGDEEEAINAHYDRLITEELLKAHELAHAAMEQRIDAAVVAIVGVNITDTEPVEPPPCPRVREIFDEYEAAKAILLNARNQCIANMYAWRFTTTQ